MLICSLSLRGVRDASSALSGQNRRAASRPRTLAGAARSPEAGSVLRRRRPQSRTESPRTLRVRGRGHAGREPRLHGARQWRQEVGRQARRGSAIRGRRLAALMGNRVPPAGGLLRATWVDSIGPAGVARHRRGPAERRTLPARPAQLEERRRMVLVRQPVCRHARVQGPRAREPDARQLGLQGQQQPHLRCEAADRRRLENLHRAGSRRIAGNGTAKSSSKDPAARTARHEESNRRLRADRLHPARQRRARRVRVRRDGSAGSSRTSHGPTCAGCAGSSRA